MKIEAAHRLKATDQPDVVRQAIEDIKQDIADYETLLASTTSEERRAIWTTRIQHLKTRLHDWQNPED